MKKLFLAISCLCLVIYSASAQFELGNNLVSSSDKLIISALEGSLVVVRQDYAFKRKGDKKLYVLPGKKYFNRVYQVGLWGKGKIWVDGNFFNAPWLQDSLYFSYKKRDLDNKDSATKAGMALRFQAKKEFSSGDSLGLKKWQEEGTMVSGITNDTLSDLTPSMASEVREGWLLVVHTPEIMKAEKDEQPLAFTLLKLDKDALKTTTQGLTVTSPLTAQLKKRNVIGGLFFATKASLGQVQFVPAGLLVSRDHDWQVQLFGYQPPSNHPLKVGAPDGLIEQLEAIPDSSTTTEKSDKKNKKSEKETAQPDEKPKKKTKKQDPKTTKEENE